MPLEYNVSNGQSNGIINVNEITQQLQQNGEQVLGVSADGSTIKMQDASGPFDAKTDEVLQDLGWQVSGVKPQDADYSHVNSDWRAAINLLPADEHRRAYIQGQLQRAGMTNANIVGSGRDWFAFDPESNRYVALTNSPDWDKSDAMEAAVKLPRFLGSTIGGAAGGILGGGITPAAVAGSAVGAGAGGALADSATRYMMAQRDPMLKEVMGQNLGAVVGDIGEESMMDALAAGLVPAAGLGIKSASPFVAGISRPANALFKNGPLSTAARSVGTVAEAGGTLLNKAAKFADQPLGRSLGAPLVPGGGQLNALGWAGQMPGWLISKGAEGLGSLGESQILKMGAPDAAQALRSVAYNSLKKSPGLRSSLSNELSQGTEEIGRFLSGMPKTKSLYSSSPENVLGNIGEMSSKEYMPYKKAIEESFKHSRSLGVDPQAALDIARINVDYPAQMAARREIGRKIGRGIQKVQQFSEGAEKLSEAGAGAIYKGARGLGYGVGKLGQAAKLTGNITSPIEAKSALRYGAEEFYRPYLESQRTWQDPRKKAKMLIASEE